jgi:ClpP class serine protease
MSNWAEILDEVRVSGSTHDIVRRKYLRRLFNLTKRNVIIYYSGWLQKPGTNGVQVNDADKNGLMAVTHKLDRSKGLDLILHTPGGETAATESLVDYLRSMWGTNVRAIIPQLAMSAGTMIACSCKQGLVARPGERDADRSVRAAPPRRRHRRGRGPVAGRFRAHWPGYARGFSPL